MEPRFQQLLEFFPEPLHSAAAELLERRGDEAEEFRFRRDAPIGVLLSGREVSLRGGDRLLTADASLFSELLRRASKNSAYAVQDQIRQGFLTIPGGHRMGICGTAVCEKGRIQTIREIQSLSLRISHERLGAADPCMNLLWSHPGSALIHGSPGSGKTTVLRDAVRQLSDRFCVRVGVVDERGEIAACLDGQPQFRIGRLTDVLSFCPKREGIELLLRSMRPDWIAVDEITAEEDVEAILRASYCGVRFLATAHTLRPDDLQRRPIYRQLLSAGVFENQIRIAPDRSLECERMAYA